ncbi:MAG TPA: hypothetical protein VFA23_03305, partial [Dongiaceae bacterium]|nr:hypothetical protein [Dongiaceae bacterium]
LAPAGGAPGIAAAGGSRSVSWLWPTVIWDGGTAAGAGVAGAAGAGAACIGAPDAGGGWTAGAG